MEENQQQEKVEGGSSSSNLPSTGTPDVSASAEKNKSAGRKGSGGQKKVNMADGTESEGANTGSRVPAKAGFRKQTKKLVMS